MTFDEYVAAVYEAEAEHPDWRTGQTYFDVLCKHNRVLAEEILGTVRDPFYIDARCAAFLRHVGGQLGQDVVDVAP